MKNFLKKAGKLLLLVFLMVVLVLESMYARDELITERPDFTSP